MRSLDRIDSVLASPQSVWDIMTMLLELYSCNVRPGLIKDATLGQFAVGRDE